MKVLAINGSSRKNSNTGILIHCVFEELEKEADGILLGSPVYSANISSFMQAVLERAAVVCDMNPGLMQHKVGVLEHGLWTDAGGRGKGWRRNKQYA